MTSKDKRDLKLEKSIKTVAAVFRIMGGLLVGSFGEGAVASTTHLQDVASEFVFDTLMGQAKFALSDYKGKVVMIANTASQCGFTGQYQGLEELYQKYKSRGFVIIGVPSNDFGGQEPGSHEEIADFCKINYGVSFPMTAKYHVRGSQAHPFYLWAKKKLGFGTAPKWNFHKYILDRRGRLVDYFHSVTSPTSSRVIKVVEKHLSTQ